jgi:hypothetical protein
MLAGSVVSDVCVPAWFGVVCAVVVVVALALLVRSWLRRRHERREGRVRERTRLSAGDWINLGVLLLGVAGAVASIVHCPDHPPDVGISLTDSRLDPAGYDDPSDEYVCLVNSDDQPVSLAGWELRGAERRVNVLPSFTLKPGAAVRVHPGEGANSAHDLYGEEGSPQWRNEGGQISLFDSEEQEVDSVGYGERKDDDGSGECGSKVATPATTGETTTGETTTRELRAVTRDRRQGWSAAYPTSASFSSICRRSESQTASASALWRSAERMPSSTSASALSRFRVIVSAIGLSFLGVCPSRRA